MYLILFSCCKVVNGAKFSIILDTQRQLYYQIPDTMSEVISMLNDFSFSEVRNALDTDSLEVFDSYVDFLIRNELAFYTDTPDQFLNIGITNLRINNIFNCVIEISSFVQLKKYISALRKIKIQAMHINIHAEASCKQLNNLLNKITSETEVISLSISLASELKLNMEDLKLLKNQYPIINKIYLHNSIYETTENSNFLTYIKKSPVKSCGAIDSCFFSCNTQTYQEAQVFNSCLNNKISIDKDGFIKNCLSMKQTFGNINDNIRLESIIEHSEFKKYWHLTKDNIEICKNCEFRYICTDCRAYTEQSKFSNDKLDVSKPLKCGYDPYKGEWEDWSTNPLKQKVIQSYGL